MSNYPNPFSHYTTINVNVKQAGRCSIIIYDYTGMEIKELLNNMLPYGEHAIQWDGTNSLGHEVCKGVYLYQICSENSLTETKLMIKYK